MATGSVCGIHKRRHCIRRNRSTCIFATALSRVVGRRCIGGRLARAQPKRPPMRSLRQAIVVTVAVLGCAPGSSSTAAIPHQPPSTVEWSEAPRRIRGIVADSLGNPLLGVTIVQSICPAGSAAPCNDSPSIVACSNAAGRFSFELSKDGDYIVAAMINGFFVGDERIVIPRAPTSVLRLTAKGVDRARSMPPASLQCSNRAN